MEASIVIPSYNGGEDFKESLRMVFEQKVGLPFEVIVIDSGSRDHTLDFLKGYPIRLKQITTREFNHGLTRNMGIELAQGRYVVLMGQDAIPADSYWLQNILENFSDELVAGVYCRQVPKKDADVLTKRHLNNWLTGRQDQAVNFIENREAYNALEPMKKLMLCTFDDVCSCVRKSVWEKIPYTETYFAEDLEWGKKAIEAGYKIVYEPRAAVIHSHSRSVLYEYKRTYLCHRRLFKIFGLETVPTLKHALKFSILNILKDTPYVMKEEKDWKRRFSLILKIPFLSFSSVFGQYMGARDERLGHPLKNFRGV
ncbi:MAG TPA: glycosyltransferase [Thermodesulfobacteriota bacterium]|nr:glycosyltransferase [Thermodesulfobacteriota bacterium]